MSRIAQAAVAIAVAALAASAADVSVPPAFLGPTAKAVAEGHVVPVDKKLDPKWVESLQARGRRKVYRGKELFTIGMPCGGIGAGQLYVRGDGTLGQWWIFNNAWDQRHCSGYQTYRPPSPIEQGFAVRVAAKGQPARVAQLSEKDFDAIELVGEYPIAEIRYRRKADPLPVAVTSEVFSPWIPLNARASANPATILRFTVANTSDRPVEVTLAGWLQNGAGLTESTRSTSSGHNRRPRPGPALDARSRNTVIRQTGLTCVRMDLAGRSAKPEAGAAKRPDIVFDDFEGGTYAKWTARGEAFGKRPAKAGEIYHPQAVRGGQGKYLVDSLGPRGVYDGPRGKLTSSAFRIERRQIRFRIGGGRHAGKTCMNLLVGGKVVRSAVGDNTERLRPAAWSVAGLEGKQGVLEIVDAASGPWGHVMVDEIVLTDAAAAPSGDWRENQATGDMTLCALDAKAEARAGWESKAKFLARLAAGGKPAEAAEMTYPLNTTRCGVVASSVSLRPGQSAKLTFLVTWYFPNHYHRGRKVGQMYANWYRDSMDVARYIAKNFQRLDRETHLFRETYFDTTLPYWLVHRIGMPVSNLATGTAEWWANGRFYGWEGVQCCEGTCTHVWHYEQATARLQPQLSRSMLVKQHLSVGFDKRTGLVGFRGEAHRRYAADGQAGVILMCYRQHLMSKDGSFLAACWPAVKKMMQFMIDRDGAGDAKKTDGIVETSDHTTYDINFVGANPHTGSMYLAALRASEAMARLRGEGNLADRYRRIYESGANLAVEKQFNGDYFEQILPPGGPTKWQIGKGCLTSQLLGNGWTDQVGLGPVYPEPVVRKTLGSIFRYNWIPDVGPYYQRHKPIMVFVKPGEAGLLICTYPLGSRLKQPLMYRNTIMQGYDYDAANQMLRRGMLLEGLAVYRANHDNYDPAKHNPWNEQQCGDHYARAMTAWGALISICGYLHDGPAARIGFAPRFHPEDFKAFFTAARGWGSLAQKRSANAQTSRIELKWGKLDVKTLLLEVPEGKIPLRVTVTLAGKSVSVHTRQTGKRITISLDRRAHLDAGRTIEARLVW